MGNLMKYLLIIGGLGFIALGANAVKNDMDYANTQRAVLNSPEISLVSKGIDYGSLTGKYAACFPEGSPLSYERFWAEVFALENPRHDSGISEPRLENPGPEKPIVVPNPNLLDIEKQMKQFPYEIQVTTYHNLFQLKEELENHEE